MAVFEPRTVAQIAWGARDAMGDLHRAQEVLKERYAFAEEPSLALILALLTGEPLLFVGPPGTAKTEMIHDICRFMGINMDPQEGSADKTRGEYFEYLLTEFTEPSELFGYYNLALLASAKPRVERIVEGTMQCARVVYLDEVFNGSSAILNSLLTFMQEKRFYDRGEVKKMQWQAIFAATNRVPDRPELRAIFDRFVLRCDVDSVVPTRVALADLAKRGWKLTYGNPPAFRFRSSLLKELDDLCQAIAHAEFAPNLNEAGFAANFCNLVALCRTNGLSDMSNRRVVKMLHVMLLHAIYRSVLPAQRTPPTAIELGREELELFKYFIDPRENTSGLEKMIIDTVKH